MPNRLEQYQEEQRGKIGKGVLVTTNSQFQEALRVLKECGDVLVVDTETTGLMPFNGDKLCAIQIGPAFDLTTERDYYFPFRHAEGENLPLELLQPLRDLLRGKTLMGHNIGFDLKFLWRDGFELPPKVLDTIVAAHSVNELEESFALKTLCKQLFGAHEVAEDTELQAELRRRRFGKGDISKLPAALVAPYGLADIRLTKRLYMDRLRELRKWRLEELYYDRCRFLLQLLRSEIAGIHLDKDEVRRQQAKIGPLITQYRQNIERLARAKGIDSINVNSPAQLGKWLGLKSTNKVLLDEILLREAREDIQTLLDYRAIFKANSTYFEPLLNLADENSRIHTNYKLHGTVTWRLSSSEPNLQNCSREQSNRIYSVRSCLAAPGSTFLLEADYASVEPRLTAHYSKDPGMLEAFRQGYDFHMNTAKYLFNKPNIAKDERQTAKTFGLAVIYGLGATRAAKQLGLRHRRSPDGSWEEHLDLAWGFTEDGKLEQFPCSVLNAEFCTCAGKAFRGRYYGAIPELEPTMKLVRNKAREIGYIRNPLTGAVQRFDNQLRNPHKAFNALIQNSAAEVLRRSFTKLGEMFTRPEDPKIVLTVHDSIAFEIQENERAMEYAKIIKHVMEETTKVDVPLDVELKVGKNLASMGVINL